MNAANTETAIAPLGASMESWHVLREQANVLLKSGYLPAHIKSAEQAIAIIMTGQELGISPTRALAGITVIQGKPTLSAELMAVLIYRDHGPDALVFEETSDTRCVIAYKRRGAARGGTFSFSMDDAKKAGLAQSQTWQKFPGAMLRARAISGVARFAFPDSIAGCYTPEELGAEVRVRGEQIEVIAPPVDTSAIEEPSAPLQLMAHPPQAEPVDEGDLPAPKKWTPELAQMAGKLKILTGEDIAIPDQMTRAEARALKAKLVSLLAEAEERVAAQRNAPAVADHVDPPDETLPF